MRGLGLMLIVGGLAAATHASAATPPKCAELRGMSIAAAAIGLPTRGAGVVTADAVAASEAAPAHCLVTGAIRPLESKAPDIEFQVALPLDWNGKALMLGGGGFSGTVPRITARLPGLPAGAPSPLARGYAVFGGDSGHRNKAVEPGDFMLNREAYDNYTGDALKKTRDAAVAVVRAAYGADPRRAYFFGGSTGGREGLLVAGRWPADWDGVVSRFPALHLITSVLGGHNTVQALAAPGAWMSPVKRQVLYRAALATCDALDGARDGVIANVKGCDAVFDPAKATLDGRPVRCPDGADAGDTCLSDAQLAALARIHAGVRFGFRLASGDMGHPGYNVYTSDNGVPGASAISTQISFLSFGAAPPAFPATNQMTLQATYGDNFFRYSVGAGDLAYNSLTLDPATPSPDAAAQLSALSARDAADNDLSAFAKRGGRLLLVQGLADTIISPRMTEQYYKGLEARMGARTLSAFIRYYEIAGWNHGLSATFNASWDDLAALEGWVERGVDPGETGVVTDTTGVPGRTRPLCLYPRWPRYDGAGDINAAASFSCTAK